VRDLKRRVRRVRDLKRRATGFDKKSIFLFIM